MADEPTTPPDAGPTILIPPNLRSGEVVTVQTDAGTLTLSEAEVSQLSRVPVTVRGEVVGHVNAPLRVRTDGSVYADLEMVRETMNEIMRRATDFSVPAELLRGGEYSGRDGPLRQFGPSPLEREERLKLKDLWDKTPPAPEE
jgi:hypothetical protein